MKQPGRISAAIEVLTEALERKRPAGDALRDWGKAHRFAGSGDRHHIGTIVYDALRQRNSSAHGFNDPTPRQIILGLMHRHWNVALDELKSLAEEQHGPGTITPEEESSLAQSHDAAPDEVRGNYPVWMDELLRPQFGDSTLAEMQALASRAPIDLRTNTLKTTRDELITKLVRFGATAAPLSPLAIRIPSPGPDDKHVNVEAEPAHGMGMFEMQDAASQVAALLAGVEPGQTVIDLCAGAGGKTLALAAQMQNQGKLIAHDKDRHRLRPIFERLTRAGVTNVEVIGAHEELSTKADCVFVDAPCTGTGAWRRKPESKWKLTQKLLAQRIEDQRSVLASAASLVKSGGRLIYITCSILPCENQDQVKHFLKSNPQFKLLPYPQEWQRLIGTTPPTSADGSSATLTLTPRQHDVDGFFVAVMQRA